MEHKQDLHVSLSLSLILSHIHKILLTKHNSTNYVHKLCFFSLRPQMLQPPCYLNLSVTDVYTSINQVKRQLVITSKAGSLFYLCKISHSAGYILDRWNKNPLWACL